MLETCERELDNSLTTLKAKHKRKVEEERRKCLHSLTHNPSNTDVDTADKDGSSIAVGITSVTRNPIPECTIATGPSHDLTASPLREHELTPDSETTSETPVETTSESLFSSLHTEHPQLQRDDGPPTVAAHGPLAPQEDLPPERHMEGQLMNCDVAGGDVTTDIDSVIPMQSACVQVPLSLTEQTPTAGRLEVQILQISESVSVTPKRPGGTCLEARPQALATDDNTHASGTVENYPVPRVTAMTAEEEQRPDLSTLLLIEGPVSQHFQNSQQELATMQAQDPDMQELLAYVKHGRLPKDRVRAQKIVLQQSLFSVVDGVLYYVDPKQGNRKRAVAPKSLQKRLLEETHSGPFGAHFSGQRIFNVLVTSWWWEHMFTNTTKFSRACTECAITTGVGRKIKPPLHPIPVQRPFQILGIDVMDLPLTESGNRHVVVIQDLFTKWPFVFPVPDQRAPRIARLLAEEVIPWFGVPEALLSDRGANLLSHLVLDLCKMLGITKLNTTSYHPQCDGAVERFNRTLKQILRKHVARFGRQWDRYLPGILWAYRNTLHSSTGEKPSFLLFGVDCRSPTDAAYLPVSDISSVDVVDYREELMVSLSSARDLALKQIQKAQATYKGYYDQKTRETGIRVGDWVLVHFPQEESGWNRKLSKPWHGPYRVTSRRDPNVTCTKVYFPHHGDIHIHQSRMCPCPPDFPAGYFWFGSGRRGPGRPPRWIGQLLTTGCVNATQPEDSPQLEDSPLRLGNTQQDTPQQTEGGTDHNESVVNTGHGPDISDGPPRIASEEFTRDLVESLDPASVSTSDDPGTGLADSTPGWQEPR